MVQLQSLMAKYNMKKIITLLLLTFIVSFSFAQQYTPMTAAGYQYKRTKTDSTMHIPSFCGVPTLRNSTALQGALAMDTCNNKLYKWTHAAGWNEIVGTAIDTANQFVNNVTKINDTAIRVWKGTTSSVISLAKDVVYTQSPIMSKISNDSNIIYFNEDTANAWRGGGGGSTPTLQEVTTAGATTDLTFTGYGISSLFQTDYNSFENNPSYIYYPLKYSTLEGANGFGYIKAFDENTGAITPELRFKQLEGYTLNPRELSWDYSTGAYIKLLPIEESYPSSTYEIRLPVFDNGINPKDTLATLRDLRSGGGGGSGTVTNVATGYGLTGGPITTTGTIEVDTATLNDIYGQNGRFGNDTATVVMVKVHNDAGVTLTNGKVVAFSSSGTSSNEPAVRLANNKHDSTSANTIGFVSGTIAVNDTGWVVLIGKIEKLNTSAFSNGDIIYLDSISGNWTKTKPQAPYHMVYLGVVTKANAGNGTIYVKCVNGYELSEIHDVQIISPANNNVLTYESSTSLWKNKTIATALGYTPIAPADTSVFQRKSLSSYTVMANNTNATANATAQTYIDAAEQTMSNTITWATGTAPTTLTSANYTWQQIGKTVNMQFNALYVNAGASNTSFYFNLPSDMPAPVVPTGWSGASGYLYTGAASTHGTSTTINSNVGISYIRRNAANTAYEVGFIGTGVSARGFKLSITYKAQ